jgi:uncharacterized protein (TIGR03435 family)
MFTNYRPKAFSQLMFTACRRTTLPSRDREGAVPWARAVLTFEQMSLGKGFRTVLAAVLLSGLATSQPFDVASVKPSQPGVQPNSNFPLGPGDVYVQNGGLFSANNLPLVTYIFFAYKFIGNQAQSLLPQLPDWVKTEQFDIQARAEGNPGKDQMRLMMRALLSDRFKLAIHNETREVPVFAFVLVKPGKTGPQLKLHSEGVPCSTDLQPSAAQAAVATVDGGLPALCNGIFGMPSTVPGRTRAAARNVTVAFIADSLSIGANLGRPMIDKTGLTGTVDFSLEWKPENTNPVPPGAEAPVDPNALSLQEALREQLGIKLQADKASASILVLDHVEHPSAN